MTQQQEGGSHSESKTLYQLCKEFYISLQLLEDNPENRDLQDCVTRSREKLFDRMEQLFGLLHVDGRRKKIRTDRSKL
jgi:hypothetical protein